MSVPCPPTVRDLARRLGLHPATVARALANQPNVSPRTRSRVLQLAEKSGYRTNALVNALMSQVRQRHRLKPSGEVVAFLTGLDREEAWRDLPSLVSQFEGARARAAHFGFDLQPFWLGPGGERARQAARMLSARGVRGALLATTNTFADRELEIDWMRLACVTIGYSFQQAPLHRAVHDSVQIMALSYARLHGAGYRRIGLALPARYGSAGRHLWVSGYLGEQWAHRVAALPPFLYESEAGRGAFGVWLKRHRPDALIGLWPDAPLDWLGELRRRVPDDVGYATLDLAGRMGTLAGVEQDNHGVGVAAMDLLSGQLFRNEIGVPPVPNVTLVEGRWHEGATIVT